MDLPETFPLAERLSAALKLDGHVHGIEYQRPPIRLLKKPVPAAVLLLFKETPDPQLLLTRRTQKVETHKGQIAFPGGACDPEDRAQSQYEAEVQTALRETHEEVGIPPEKIQVLGRLPNLQTPTGFEITPVVGLAKSPASIVLHPSEDEIEEVFWVHLEDLMTVGVYRQETFKAGAVSFPTDVYQVQQYRIWGATAAMIKNLLDRLSLCER